jgi:hypothetical protein
MNSRADAASRGRLLKLAIILAALGPLLFCGRAAVAQDKPQPTARKFDEFGDILMTDLKARLDNFVNALQNEPGTRGFIITYRAHRDLPGLSHRLTLRTKQYLINSRGVAKERIVTVDGGPSECITQELWIVEPGAAPKPRGDAYARGFLDRGTALKFDELYYPLRPDPGFEESESWVGVWPEELEAFAAALREQPRARAYVIAYIQHRAGWRPDAAGVSRRMLREVRAELVKTFGIAPSRVRVVDGGYRVRRQMELWVVPPGARPPVATPNAYPPGR